MAHSNSKRSNLNTENVGVSPIDSSGFDLSHKCKDAIRVGHRELVGYEFVLSGDKMRVKSAADLQFKPTNGSLTPAMDLRFEHVFIPFRNINMDYEDSLSFDKGQSWSDSPYPKTTLRALWAKLLEPLTTVAGYSLEDLADLPFSRVLVTFQSACGYLRTLMSPYYIGDFADELQTHCANALRGWDSLTASAKQDVYKTLFYDIIRYFIGTGSYLDKLNLPIIKRSWLDGGSKEDTLEDIINNFFDNFGDNLPIDVMRLRCIYADWFEMVRDSNLEPARSLPRYHKLTNTLEPLEQILYCYLAPRYVPHGKDMWTTAQIDSPYRHVCAPIISAAGTIEMNDDTNDNAITATLRSVPVTVGSSIDSINVAINNSYGVFARVMDSADYDTYGLDLVALKRAQQARAWLLRNHVFGDEYQDYILAQYGVKLEDSRINKPFYLGGVSQEVNINQTVNPTTTAQMPAGAKNNTLTAGVTTDSFDFVSAENGVVFTWAFLVPAVTYEPYDSRAMIAVGTDFPQPIFANDSEEYSFACELSRNIRGDNFSSPFGRHPYAHAWRGRVDENHGDFLDELKPFTFLREFAGVSWPVLNSTFTHCHVKLDFMVDTDQFNTIAYGTFSHDNFVVRKLPVVTDVC